MPYKTKKEAEKEFVEMIQSVGIESYHCMYEKGNYYYALNLLNGEQRFWTNFSDESCEKLGINGRWCSSVFYEEYIVVVDDEEFCPVCKSVGCLKDITDDEDIVWG